MSKKIHILMIILNSALEFSVSIAFILTIIKLINDSH